MFMNVVIAVYTGPHFHSLNHSGKIDIMHICESYSRLGKESNVLAVLYLCSLSAPGNIQIPKLPYAVMPNWYSQTAATINRI